MLTPGTRIGRYEIQALIGTGGMGEVYSATDLDLARRVAIKVLPEALASHADLLERLDREAKALAALNHANVASIYGLERSGGVTALVIELVEGPTLADRISAGRIPEDEALAIGKQIASALEVAHEQGIVHRDLKPANIKLREDGTVKVLDFGLAKIAARRDTQSLSSTFPETAIKPSMTEVGTILGTAAYMSPEQARGQAVDRRTDVWAFGCVLYEMLTGLCAFPGTASAEILAAVLRGEPDWTALPPSTAAPVRALLQACLAKDRAGRLPDASTARFLLEHATTLTGPPPRVRTKRGSWSTLLAAATLAVAVGGAWWWLAMPRVSPPPVQSMLLAPPGVSALFDDGFALSPDGDRLAFVGRGADGVATLWVRSLAAIEASPVVGTEGAFAPFWSPDGRDIGFFADQRLKRVPANGGTVRTLADGMLQPKGGTWSPDGRIVYVPDFRTGLYEIAATGGEPKVVTTLDLASGENSHRWPQFLPDGETLLFLVQTAEAGAPDDHSRIETLDANGRHEIVTVNASAAYAPSGHLLFWRDGTVYAQSLDVSNRRLTGEPKAVAAGVGLTVSEWAAFAIAAHGTLVYHDASSLAWRLEWRDRAGRLLSVAAPEADYEEVALSPDARRAVYVESNTTLWLTDLARGTNTRLTFESVDYRSPAWMRSGDSVVYAADKLSGPGSEIYRRLVSGFAAELLHSSSGIVRTVAWAPDERTLAFHEDGGVIFALDVESQQVRTLVDSPGYDSAPRFSPDGRWLAYVSDESGRNEVYVVPAGGGARMQVSSRGAFDVEWGPSGNEIYFVAADNVLEVVPISAEGEPGTPTALFALPGTTYGRYEVAPDGRILVRTQVVREQSRAFILVQNSPELAN